MAKTKISEWSTTPASNTDIDGINIAEGCAPSGINDAIRDLMSQVRSWQSGASGDPFNGPMNGTIGATTAYAGAFTTVSATGVITSTLATGTAPLTIASTTKVTNLNADLLDGADWASPAALGSTTPAAVSATTLTTSSTVTLNGGTANGVTYLNGSKVLTSGSALTFDGTNLGVNSSSTIDNGRFSVAFAGNTQNGIGLKDTADASGASFWGAYNSTGGFIGSLRRSGTDNALAINGNSYLAFQQNSTEQMRLTSTGLGIGTSSPAYKLDVNGSGNIIRAINSSTTAAFMLATNSGASSILVMGNEATTAGSSATGSSSYAGLLFTTGTKPLQFGTNSTIQATLDTAGNLGLGVTPSAWSEGRAIERRFAGTADWGYLQAESYRTTNAYFNGGWKYGGTGAACKYGHVGGTHEWSIAASGTAGNAITFTQAMTLDASGNLGLGATSIGEGNFQISKTGLSTGITNVLINASFANAANTTGLTLGYRTDETTAVIAPRTATGNVAFYNYNGAWSETARFTNTGNLLVGTTTNNGSGARLSVSYAFSNDGAAWKSDSTNTHNAIVFKNPNGTVGTIQTSGSLTLYNTTSDYRLKTVIGAVTGHGERIDALEPIEYEWKTDGSRTRGFLAHKFKEVYAQSVGGEKDAVDSDGNPVYQSMQAGSSEVIADLVAEIQSLRQRVAQLETN